MNITYKRNIVDRIAEAKTYAKKLGCVIDFISLTVDEWDEARVSPALRITPGCDGTKFTIHRVELR